MIIVSVVSVVSINIIFNVGLPIPPLLSSPDEVSPLFLDRIFDGAEGCHDQETSWIEKIKMGKDFGGELNQMHDKYGHSKPNKGLTENN